MSTNENLIQSLREEGYLKTSRIIEAFRAIDRTDFVLPAYKKEAYGDYPLPIGQGQTISQPLTVAFLFELLEPKPGDKILDIGSGSGWTSALLAHIVSQKSNNQPRREVGVPTSLSKEPGEASGLPITGSSGRVYAIERIPEICTFGKNNLEKYGLIQRGIVEVFCQDGSRGLPAHAPFDKILAGASATHEVPAPWRDQLKVGGKMVVPVGNSVWVLTKKSSAEWHKQEFSGFLFVPLIKEEGKAKRVKRGNGHWFTGKGTIGYWLLAIGLAGAILANEIYRPHASYTGVKEVEITPGLGSRKIGELLRKEGVTRSKWTFVVYVSLKGSASFLKPGTYVFANASIPEIARDLVAGATNERVIVIPEGWTADEIALYLNAERVASEKEFATYTGISGSKKFIERFPFLREKPVTVGLEGYLFPDTYRVYRNTSSEDIVIKMLKNFEKKIATLSGDLATQKRSLFEIITMASLIEKEIISEEDRAVVSGILWKRLELGIPLQVDATVVYVKNKELGIIDYGNKRITQSDLKKDSSYNTYRYRGLPKGPISNPGVSAIRAALHPKPSPYLYYLSAKDGKTIFSKTLEEHNEAKTKHLR